MACCGKSKIKFLHELVEGEDWPLQLPTEFDYLSRKTVGLLLQMLKITLQVANMWFLKCNNNLIQLLEHWMEYPTIFGGA